LIKIQEIRFTIKIMFDRKPQKLLYILWFGNLSSVMVVFY